AAPGIRRPHHRAHAAHRRDRQLHALARALSRPQRGGAGDGGPDGGLHPPPRAHRGQVRHASERTQLDQDDAGALQHALPRLRSNDHEEPGRDEQGRIVSDTPMYGVLIGWRIVDLLNHGFVAALVWDGYEAMYDRDPMPYGLIAGPKENFRLRPYYQLIKMFT